MIYPHTARILAEEIALRAFPRGKPMDEFTASLEKHDDAQREQLAADIEKHLNQFACRAADVAGDDPSGIQRMVWYRGDGWEHGGCAISWQDRAEELANEVKELRDQMAEIHAEASAPLCADYEYDPTPTAEEQLGVIRRLSRED